MLDNVLLLAVLAVLILLLLALLYLRHPSCAPQPLRLDRLARDRATTDSMCGVTPFRWARHGTCALCADEARVLVLDGCAHDGLCKTCMRGYLTEQAGDATNFPVKCAFHVDGCRSIVSPNVARAVLGADSAEYDAFTRFHLQAAVGSLVPCPVCTVPLVYDPTDSTLRGEPVRCGHCKRSVCLSCNSAWHPGRTCDQEQGRESPTPRRFFSLRLKPRPTTQSLLRQGKQCPRCRTHIIHYRGHACHHIMPSGGCPSCGHHFCYVCLGPYNRCGCPFEGSTFCGRSPVFPFKDCGCPPCPDCKPGRPCVGCDADARCRSCHPPIAKRVRKGLKRTLVALF